MLKFVTIIVIFFTAVATNAIAETSRERCLRISGVTAEDLSVNNTDITSREILRQQIIRDMALYRNLQDNGCRQLAAIFKDRATSLKPSLRHFTRESIANEAAMQSFQITLSAFIDIASMIEASGSSVTGNIPHCRMAETTFIKSDPHYHTCLSLPVC